MVTESDRAIECCKCSKWIHIKCNKITVKQYKSYQDNPDDIFECKNCNQCNVCHKVVAKNHKAIECNICLKWVHIGCNKLNQKDYHTYQRDEDRPFYCIKCLSDSLPLQTLNNNQFDLTSKGIDYPEELNVEDIHLSFTQLDLVRKINNSISKGFINISDDDSDDDDDVQPIDCKYYSIEELNGKKHNSIKNFSILHLNIHSLEFHIEELRIALQLINLKFDFICLSESKIKKNIEPKSNIKIEGYQTPVGTSTEACKGGVIIYVKEGIDFRPREDLNLYKAKELESFFIEAIDKKGKNTIIGCIYRHPCMDENIFLDDFMQPLNDKLSNENKKIFLAGDFNFNLLNTNNTETLMFFESMMSNHLLPTITIPTKINPKKAP